MADFEIQGLDQLQAMSKALKGWDSEFRKDFNRDVRNLARPVIPDLRAAVEASYPKRGGLAARMAKAKMTPGFLTGRNPTIRIVVKGLQIKLGEVYGVLRHPVFADSSETRKEWTWVNQPVELKDAMQTAAGQHVRELVPGMQRVLDKATQRVLGKAVK